MFQGNVYPAKAFGDLVAQLALNTLSAANDMTTNQAVAPLEVFGCRELPPMAEPDTNSAARERRYHQVLSRPRQAMFRQLILGAYSACAISGVSSVQALEAAHVVPFADDGTDLIGNGILLRCDLHKLFDYGEFAVDPDSLVATFSREVRRDYQELHGRKVRIPVGGPDQAAFRKRWTSFADGT